MSQFVCQHAPHRAPEQHIRSSLTHSLHHRFHVSRDPIARHSTEGQDHTVGDLRYCQLNRLAHCRSFRMEHARSLKSDYGQVARNSGDGIASRCPDKFDTVVLENPFHFALHRSDRLRRIAVLKFEKNSKPTWWCSRGRGGSHRQRGKQYWADGRHKSNLDPESKRCFRRYYTYLHVCLGQSDRAKRRCAALPLCARPQPQPNGQTLVLGASRRRVLAGTRVSDYCL